MGAARMLDVLERDSAFTDPEIGTAGGAAATMRMGAPLANAPIAPSAPTPMPTSALPAIDRLLGFAGTLRAQRLEFDAYLA